MRKNFVVLIILILFITSCASTADKNAVQTKAVESSKQERKIDTNKLAKEAGYIIGWDIILAAGCKLGLHLSIGVCLAADVIGDVGIISYHNFDVKEKIIDSKKPKSDQKMIAQKPDEQKKKSSFHPIEFVLSVGLMAIMLVII